MPVLANNPIATVADVNNLRLILFENFILTSIYGILATVTFF
jgi:hypothetical protein